MSIENLRNYKLIINECKFERNLKNEVSMNSEGFKWVNEYLFR